MKALGVKPLMAVVSGDMTLDEAAYLTKRDSRHYAKRQMTWLRNNFHPNLLLKSNYRKVFYRTSFLLFAKNG